MLPLQQLQDIGLAQDKDSLRRLLIKAANDLGFGLISAALIRGDMRSGRAWLEVVSNPPAAYVDAANSLSDTLRDPVMEALHSSTLPALYDQATYVGSGVADLWDLQAPHGYRCGVACSVHQPSHLETFLLGVDRPDELPKDAVGRMRLTAAMQMLTVHAQEAMQRIFTPAPSGALVLEGDELECLRWARDGYTVWQIGDRLSISTTQVQQHQRRAVRKAGASSVSGAVLRCIRGGLMD